MCTGWVGGREGRVGKIQPHRTTTQHIQTTEHTPGCSVTHPPRLAALDPVLSAIGEQPGGGRVARPRQAVACGVLSAGQQLQQVAPVLLSVLQTTLQTGAMDVSGREGVQAPAGGPCNPQHPAGMNTQPPIHPGRQSPANMQLTACCSADKRNLKQRRSAHQCNADQRKSNQPECNSTHSNRWLCPLRTCWRLELNSWCPLPARLLNIWGATALASAASSCGQQFGAAGVGAQQGQDRGPLAWWRLRHVQERVTRLTACVHPQPSLLQTCRPHQPLTSTVASSPPSVVTASFSYAMGSAPSAAGGAPVLPVSSATPTWVAGGEVRWGGRGGGRGSLSGSRQEEVAAVQFGRPPAPQTQPAKPSPHLGELGGKVGGGIRGRRLEEGDRGVYIPLA